MFATCTKLRNSCSIFVLVSQRRILKMWIWSRCINSCYLKPKTSEYPTILFFRTGSYTIMGAKKKDILIECQTFVNNIIIMFNKHCIWNKLLVTIIFHCLNNVPENKVHLNYVPWIRYKLGTKSAPPHFMQFMLVSLLGYPR